MPPAQVLKVSTFGLLQPELRERFGVHWKRGNEIELRALGRASRAAGPLLPATLKTMGPAYLRWRADQIARGPLGSAGVASRRDAGASGPEVAQAA
jgi:uncharacterized protein (DUF2236 family)